MDEKTRLEYAEAYTAFLSGHEPLKQATNIISTAFFEGYWMGRMDGLKEANAMFKEAKK